jgi:hypothetical protein
MMDWGGVQTPTTQEKAEREGEVWTGKCATRPLPHTREGRDEKVRYGGLVCPDPPTTREGREREGEV